MRGASAASFASARLAWAIALGFIYCGRMSIASPSVGWAKTNSSASGGLVAKTTVSNKMRLVYIFGVEGSGHHYVIGALNGIFEAYPDLPQITKGFPAKEPYYIPFTMKESAAAFDQARKLGHVDMRDLAVRTERLSYPGTIQQLNAASIPTGRGPQKVMQYADLRLIAEAAEAGGIDLRVLYMKRPANQILLANTVHRQFQNFLGDPDGTSAEEKFMEYVRILFTDIAVVQSFLGELDPAFVVCHDWGSFGDADQAREIADAISPNPDMASLVREALVVSSSGGARHANDETHQFDDANILSARLQQKLDSFEWMYCGRDTH